MSSTHPCVTASKQRPALDAAWAAGIFLACVLLYWPGLSPSVVAGDGGEFQALSYVLGIAHPTGYPLFLLLGWIAAHLPLGGDVAYRLNLFSLLTGAGAMVFFYLVLRELDIRQAVAALSTLLLASAPRLWMHADAVEVYPLSVLLILLASWLLLRWGKGRAKLWVVALALGFGLTHHISFRLLGPAVLAYLFLVEPRLLLHPRQWLPALPALVLPLALYAYVPLRAANFLALPQLQGQVLGLPKAVAAGYVAPQYTSGGFAKLVLALNESRAFFVSTASGLAALPQYLALLGEQFPLLIVLPMALLGLGAMFVRRWRDALFFVLAYIVVFWFSLRYLNVAPDLDHFIPCIVLTGLYFAYGADLLLDWLRRRLCLTGWRGWIPIAMLACLPIYNIAWQFPGSLESRQLQTKAQASAILSQPLPEGSIIAGAWSDLTPLRYLQQVEHVRPDIWTFQATEERIRDALVPQALAEGAQLYALRPTEVGLRLLPVPAPAATRIAQPADVGLGEDVRWRGSDLLPTEVAPGTVLPITLYWQVQGVLDRNWTTFIHVLDENGQGVVQVDRIPVGWFYPPLSWQPGQLVADQYELGLPADLGPGRYTLVFGWYDGSERLHWQGGETEHVLGTVEVRR